MKKSIVLLAVAIFASTATASELVFQFNSPAFSGQGYSSHVLTIEQLEQQRRDKIKADEQAAIDRAERELRSTNIYRFQNNLESRIYAQLSREITESIFGEGGGLANSGQTETPFGDTIKWERTDGLITVIITNSNNEVVSEFTVPVGDFAL